MKCAVFGAVAMLIVVGYVFREHLSLDSLARREADLRAFQVRNPVVVFGLAFLAYVLITGLSLPGAAVMTLLMGWFFGFWQAVFLVSFASTAGATMAFLLSRYLFRDVIQRRFADRLAVFNAQLEKDGAFYLFTLRLIPAVPFFVINVVMGLTNIRVWTYWWISQVGMLAATMVFVYAGSRVPDLQTLADEGAGAVFTGSQLFQITLALTLLGVFPIAVKKLVGLFRPTMP